MTMKGRKLLSAAVEGLAIAWVFEKLLFSLYAVADYR